MLVHPDFDLPFHIHCDVSGKGIGVVLSQYVDGAYYPIAFCSKKLMFHQTHWAPAQLEAYAIFHVVVEKWRYYLSLSKCIVHSDHHNLIWIFDHSHKGMIDRWYTSLCAFDLDIIYVSGNSQFVADPLSRLFPQLKEGTYKPRSSPVNQDNHGNEPAVSLSTMVQVEHPDCPFSLFSGRRQCLYGNANRIQEYPSSVHLTPEVSRLVQQFTSTQSVKNAPRSVWTSHQRVDPKLSEIYRYLSSDSTEFTEKFSGALRVRTQSYHMVNGVLHYRSIHEVGSFDLNEGWVVAVPHSFIDKVIE